jgi:hypothetical protein
MTRIRRPLRGVQEAVYVTYAAECKERNADALLQWQRRREHGALPDRRKHADIVRYRHLQCRQLQARYWLANRALAAIADSKPRRHLMKVAS